MAEHYFSAEPAGAEQQRVLDLTLAGREVSVLTSGGVFSGGRLDLGTRVLLRWIDAAGPAGPFLDLGCGWGPIALSIGLTRPQAEVWAVDVNERAVRLTATNAERLRLSRIHAVTPDQVPETMRFQEIWSNPPIRIGKPQLHQLLSTWLPRMDEHGRAMLVVQRNLGADSLIDWINQQLPGLRAYKHSSAKGFRVIEVTRA